MHVPLNLSKLLKNNVVMAFASLCGVLIGLILRGRASVGNSELVSMRQLREKKFPGVQSSSLGPKRLVTRFDRLIFDPAEKHLRFTSNQTKVRCVNEASRKHWCNGVVQFPLRYQISKRGPLATRQFTSVANATRLMLSTCTMHTA